MPKRQETVAALSRHADWRDFFVPSAQAAEFRDATYYLRRDGTLVFSEGYYHQAEKPAPERKLISHIVYVPLRGGDAPPEYTLKTVFGQRYENITKAIMATEPLDRFYPLQFQRYLELDPAQASVPRPVYARYKAMVPVAELLGAFPTRHSLQAILSRADRDPAAESIRAVTSQTARLLGIPEDRFGITGSLSLGCYSNPHDLDFVIHGSAAEVGEMVDFMYSLTDREEKRRVFEFGKFWPIRFWDYHGADRFMVCPFFSYLDPAEAPLRDFDCEELGEVEFGARIADALHNAFNPTILGVEETSSRGPGAGDFSRIVLYHGGERGDWREGARVRGQGTRCLIRTYRREGEKRLPQEKFTAVVINNLAQVFPAEGGA